jgi:hypothetical protein
MGARTHTRARARADLVPQQLRDAMARYAARLAALSPAARADALARADASAAVHAGLFSSAGGAIMAQLNALVPLQLRGSGSEGDRGRVFVTLHGGGDAGWAEYLAWRSARKEHSFAHGFSLALGDASDGASVAATAPAEAVARAHAQLVRPLQPRVGESPVACLRAQKELEEGADLVVAHALSPAALRDASSEAYRRALLAQVATALQTLRARGHLALVVGQVSDAFTVGLLYIAHRHFRVTHVLRPDCQREAGAGERVFFFQDLVAPPFAPTLQVLARAERDLAAAPERHEEGVDYMRKKVLHERPFMDLIVKQNHRAALASLASLAAAARLAADERLFPAPSKLAFARRRRELWRLPPLS